MLLRLKALNPDAPAEKLETLTNFAYSVVWSNDPDFRDSENNPWAISLPHFPLENLFDAARLLVLEEWFLRFYLAYFSVSSYLIRFNSFRIPIPRHLSTVFSFASTLMNSSWRSQRKVKVMGMEKPQRLQLLMRFYKNPDFE